MNTSNKTLRDLALACFQLLTTAEEKLLGAATNGSQAVCTTPTDCDQNLTNANTWGQDRTIRAELLRWLCVDHEAQKYIDARGLKIHLARVVGVLDLSFAEVGFPIFLTSCALPDGIALTCAQTRLLSFEGSYASFLIGDGLITQGPMNLQQFNSFGPVRLPHAKIIGELNCNDARLSNASGDALNADSLTVNGNVFFKKAVIQGLSRFTRATISGNVECQGAHFINRGKTVLLFDHATIRGNLQFTDRLLAVGEVSLIGAQVGGNLDCGGGQFRNWTGTKRAITADALRANAVYLNSGFVAVGDVRLLAAKVETEIACYGGRFLHKRGIVLGLDGAEIGLRLSLNFGFVASGEVSLLGAKIGGDFSCIGGYFCNPGGRALSADKVAIGGTLHLNQISDEQEQRLRQQPLPAQVSHKRTRVLGEIRLLGCRVGGDLDCRGTHLLNPGGKALHADGIRVDRGVLLDHGFRALGEVRLPHAKISDDLSCEGAHLLNRGQTALLLSYATIGGSVFCSHKFRAFGEVRMVGVTIGNSLNCRTGLFLNRGKGSLIVDTASISGNVFCEDGFRSNGIAWFAGARIEGSLSFFKAEFSGTAVNGAQLANATIAGTLAWRSVTTSPTTALGLSQAKIRELADDQSSWPAAGKLVLDGFTYASINADSPRDTSVRLKWLELQPAKHFVLQPYEQVARIFRATGHQDKADRILYAAIERERGAAAWGRWLWLTTLKYLIGYGYRVLSPIFCWVICMTVLGAVLLKLSGEGALWGMPYGLSYSLDMLLPILELREYHYKTEFTGWIRYYFYFHKTMGWVLMSFLIVGLSGLTRRR